MIIKTTNYFHEASEASDFINSLPQGTHIDLGMERRQKFVKGKGLVDTVMWKVIVTTDTENESTFYMGILHELEYEDFINPEQNDAINYAISCIKTLQDMEIIK